MNRRQRGIAVDLILYLVAGAFIIGIAGWAAWQAQHWCNTVCKDAKAEAATATARADAAEATIAAAERESKRLLLAWAADSVAAQSRAIQAEGERNARFTPIHTAARSLPPADAGVRIPQSAVSVLDRAVDAGNVAIARSAAETAGQAATPPPDPAGAVDVAGLTAWGAKVTELYAACADQLAGWQAFYAGLQRAQSTGAVP